MSTISIVGSHGSFEVDINGVVIDRDTMPEEYRGIYMVDLNEWERYWGRSRKDVGGIDVLDIGAWSGAGEHEPAEMDWREEVKRMREEEAE